MLACCWNTVFFFWRVFVKHSESIFYWFFVGMNSHEYSSKKETQGMLLSCYNTTKTPCLLGLSGSKPFQRNDMMFLFHSFSHQVCYLKLPKKSEGSANVQWSRLDHSFLVYWDPKQRPETSRVFSVKNHKTSFFLGEIFWERFVGQPLGVHDVQFSHLQSLFPCFIGEIWTQTNWRISDLNPSIF